MLLRGVRYGEVQGSVAGLQLTSPHIHVKILSGKRQTKWRFKKECNRINRNCRLRVHWKVTLPYMFRAISFWLKADLIQGIIWVRLIDTGSILDVSKVIKNFNWRFRARARVNWLNAWVRTFIAVFFGFYCTLFNTAWSAAPQIHCVGECWDRTQDCWNFSAFGHSNHMGRSHPWLDFIQYCMSYYVKVDTFSHALKLSAQVLDSLPTFCMTWGWIVCLACPAPRHGASLPSLDTTNSFKPSLFLALIYYYWSAMYIIVSSFL